MAAEREIVKDEKILSPFSIDSFHEKQTEPMHNNRMKSMKILILWVFFQWIEEVYCFSFMGRSFNPFNTISVKLPEQQILKNRANITSDDILERLENLGGQTSDACQQNYADYWDEVPSENMKPIDFGRIQWCRGKNFYNIPDTAMLHVALKPDRNARAIELFYEIVKGRFSGKNEYKPYNASAAYLLSHFRNTMQYHFAAEVSNYFLHHLEAGNVHWKNETVVREHNLLEKNYIPDRIFPPTLDLFGIPEKLSIKLKRIEEETMSHHCQEHSPNFYFIQQISRFLGRNAERFMSGASFAYAFTEERWKPTDGAALEQLLMEECKSFWNNKFNEFQVRKKKVNNTEQVKLIPVKDNYGYPRAHVYAVDPIQKSDSDKKPITTISVVIAGSPNPVSSWQAVRLWWWTNFGIWNYGKTQCIAGKKTACHAGIYRMYSQLFYGDKKKPDEITIEKAVTELIKETNPKNDIEIRVSGHSLGGALAQMLALDFDFNKFKDVRELYCVTLHAPPVFTKVPQLRFPKKVQLVHFYHKYDPVVLVPKILFRNAGIQVPLSSEMNSLIALPRITFHDYTKPFAWFNKIAITPYKTYFQPPPHLGSNLPVDNTRVSPV